MAESVPARPSLCFPNGPFSSAHPQEAGPTELTDLTSFAGAFPTGMPGGSHTRQVSLKGFCCALGGKDPTFPAPPAPGVGADTESIRGGGGT